MILKTSQHLENAFSMDGRQYALRKAAEQLEMVHFEVIICTGTSGVVLGSALAFALNKRLAVVRRKGERERTVSGFSREVEGWLGGHYIFFDDLISSGETKQRAMSEFQSASMAAGEEFKYMGTYLFNHHRWVPACPTSQDESSPRRTSSYLDPMKVSLLSELGTSTN